MGDEKNLLNHMEVITRTFKGLVKSILIYNELY